MTEERAVLAGGCFWGMQDLIRRYDGVLSTRVGYTGGTAPMRRIAIMRDTPKQSRSSLILPGSAIGRSSNSSSRFTTQARAIARAMTSGPATDLRSSTPVTSRSGLPKTRSPTSMLQACGRARLLRKSFRQASSGRPNPSIRIISNDIPTATPAISSGPTGDCRFAPTRLQSRPNSRSSSESHVRRCAMQCTAPVRSTVRVFASLMVMFAITAGLASAADQRVAGSQLFQRRGSFS